MSRGLQKDKMLCFQREAGPQKAPRARSLKSDEVASDPKDRSNKSRTSPHLRATTFHQHYSCLPPSLDGGENQVSIVAQVLERAARAGVRRQRHVGGCAQNHRPECLSCKLQRSGIILSGDANLGLGIQVTS